MPELKNTFTGGKMEKDLDERIVPSGQYREALNISVATSEDSDVGAAQNILGNIKVTEAIQSRTMAMNEEYAGDNYHVAEVINPLTDMLYRFIHTASSVQGIWMDRIVEFDTQATLDTPWFDKESAVMVDIFKVESTIGVHSEPCSEDPGTSNKSQISLLNGLNLNQIRWGMKVVGPDLGDPNPNWADGDVTVEDVDYINNVIILNKPIYDNIIGTGDGKNITFYSDRNLSFGDKDNIKTITGINIIDGMIFWTDNFSEPKKINIKRNKEGCDSGRWSAKGNKYPQGSTTIDDFNQHTILVVDGRSPEDCTKNDHACIISGCTDPFANNYNTNATVSDLSACTYDPSWECDSLTGTCSDPGNGQGFYLTQSDCENACIVIPPSWDCDPISNTCSDPGTGNGLYTTLAACQTACVPVIPTTCGIIDEGFEDVLVNHYGYTLPITSAQTTLGPNGNGYLMGPLGPPNVFQFLNLSGGFQGGGGTGSLPIIPRWSIENIDGIGCFTNIQSLKCDDQLIGYNGTIDLSQNTALEELRLHDTPIQELYLTNNVNLTEVFVGKTQGTLQGNIAYFTPTTTHPSGQVDVNVLHTLDVSACSALILFRAREAQISNYNHTNSPVLEEFYIDHNNLSGMMDLTQNTNLAHLDLSHNQLTGVDLSGSINIGIVRINDNNITGTIDLSNSPNLHILNCSNNPNLDYIDLSYGPTCNFVQPPNNYLPGITVNATGCSNDLVIKLDYDCYYNLCAGIGCNSGTQVPYPPMAGSWAGMANQLYGWQVPPNTTFIY